MIFEIWAEGYLDQGMEGVPAKAKFIGYSEGETFTEACENWYKEHVSKESFNKYFRISNGRPIYWCRLFDNEEDARKSFG